MINGEKIQMKGINTLPLYFPQFSIMFNYLNFNYFRLIPYILEIDFNIIPISQF